jgi:hypothetical protein
MGLLWRWRVSGLAWRVRVREVAGPKCRCPGAGRPRWIEQSPRGATWPASCRCATTPRVGPTIAASSPRQDTDGGHALPTQAAVRRRLPSAGRRHPTRRTPARAGRPGSVWVAGIAWRGGGAFGCVVDSTNGTLDGHLMAAGLAVYRADPWTLPDRPPHGSVPARVLAATAPSRTDPAASGDRKPGRPRRRVPSRDCGLRRRRGRAGPVPAMAGTRQR